MHSWIPLLIQAALTITALELIRRRLFTALTTVHPPPALIDVWCPLAIVIPTMFFIGRVETTVRGPGWMTLSAPIVALITTGVVMTLGDRKASNPIGNGIDLRSIMSWTGTGLVLVLLSGAHDLTLWTGQFAFVIAAVLIWMNSPAVEVHAAHTRDEIGASQGVGLILLCAAGQGFASLFVTLELARVSAAMMLAGAATIGTLAALMLGLPMTIRLAGWTATYGVLFALGVLSLYRLVPALFVLLQSGEAPRVQRIAFGYAGYIWEGLILLFYPALAIAQGHLPSPVRRVVGAMIVIVALAGGVWRIVKM